MRIGDEMMGYDDGNWGAWLVMIVAMLAVSGLIVWGVLTLVRGGRASTPRATPEEILRARFAAGEIDEPEFRQRLNAL